MAMAMVVEAEYSCPSAKACIIVVMENKNAKEVEVDAQVDNDLTETEKLKSAEKADAAKAEVSTAEPEAKKTEAVAPAAVTHTVTVSGNATDEVRLSKCIYKNMYARKSLSVHHVQRRLVELGYKVVDSDKDGWYGDMTKLGVAQFQADNGYDGDGLMNARTLEDLFAGDRGITVVID